MLGNEPANNLFGIGIYGKWFHSGYPPSKHHRRISESAGPAPPIRRTEVSSGVLGQDRLRALPPCFVGRPVHDVSRSTPVDDSLPCFADLASTQRAVIHAPERAECLDLDQC